MRSNCGQAGRLPFNSFLFTPSTLKISLNELPNNIGPYLDLVRITYDSQPSAVPLPAGAPLLLASLGALGLIARKRHRA